jgi:hypothetical protein
MQEERYADAFAILEKQMEIDKKAGYIRGCVIKQVLIRMTALPIMTLYHCAIYLIDLQYSYTQGTLGNLYLKQGEISSAEKIFQR